MLLSSTRYARLPPVARRPPSLAPSSCLPHRSPAGLFNETRRAPGALARSFPQYSPSRGFASRCENHRSSYVPGSRIYYSPLAGIDRGLGYRSTLRLRPLDSTGEFLLPNRPDTYSPDVTPSLAYTYLFSFLSDDACRVKREYARYLCGVIRQRDRNRRVFFFSRRLELRKIYKRAAVVLTHLRQGPL